RAAIGSNDVAEYAFPWWLMRALAPFGGFPREAADIAATFRHPVRLDNHRLEELIGPEPRTPIVEALRATLTAMGCLKCLALRNHRLPVARPGDAVESFAARYTASVTPDSRVRAAGRPREAKTRSAKGAYASAKYLLAWRIAVRRPFRYRRGSARRTMTMP